MLMILAILFLVVGLGAGVLIVFANGMSDSSSRISAWPAIALLLASTACFVLRHYLHGVAVTW